MMIEVSEGLPSCLKQLEAKLFKKEDRNMDKFILEVPKKNYRGFIYIRKQEGRYIAGSTSLRNLYNAFYSDQGMSNIIH